MKNDQKNLGKKALLMASGLMVIVASTFSAPVKTNAQMGGMIGGVAGGVLGGCGSALTSAIGSLFGGGGSGGGSSGGGSSGSSGGMNSAVPVADATVAANTATVKANTTSTKNVQCTWNGIAWQLAHVVLHMLTASVVNWINSGFKGNPSFLKNPQAFFMDAADQITGAFLAGSGPLSQLCSPFSADIRVALAIEQTQADSSGGGRYSCTLSKIVSNVQKGVNVTVNGQNVNSFMKGNFSAGGWPAFLTMTTVPQNNPFGAYLQASADLNSQIGARHAAISADLQLGGGFMSWSSCTDVNPNDYQTVSNLDSLGLGDTAASTKNGQASMDTGNGSSYKATADSSGNVSYQDCTTQTPGSVISSSLSKQLGASTDELNMTNEINQVVSALFSQLMKQVLTGGLLASTQSGSGGSAARSYIDQLANDPQMAQNFTNLQKQAVNELKQDVTPIQQALTYRNESLALMISQQNAFGAVRSCIANELQQVSSSSATAPQQHNGSAGQTASGQAAIANGISLLQGALSTLDTAIATITPQVAADQAAALEASSTLTQVEYIESQVKSTASAQDLANLNDQFSSELDSLSSSDAIDPDSAKSDYQTTTALSKSLTKTLAPYKSSCGTN